MTITENEILSQPDVWERALTLRDASRDLFRADGKKMLIIGCGTSAFIAESVAAMRESAGLGMTDAAYASEPFAWRDYDQVVAICRSGTTTEVIGALRDVPHGVTRSVVTAVTGEPIDKVVDKKLVLDFADERSVVQTRFPTTVLTAARNAFDQDITAVAGQAREVFAAELPVNPENFDHFVFLGHGWTYGLAQEAALKTRESAQAWAEAYPMFDYRHGPLAVAGKRSLVWMVGAWDARLAEDIRAVGATVIHMDVDPQVELAQIQRFAVALAGTRGLNPDQPIHLTRSIILS